MKKTNAKEDKKAQEAALAAKLAEEKLKAVWRKNVNDQIELPEKLPAYAPTGKLKIDAMKYSDLLGITTHPLFFKKPFPTPNQVPASTPTIPEDPAVKKEDEKKEEPEPTVFAAHSTELDRGTLRALQLALPASKVNTLRFINCALSVPAIETVCKMCASGAISTLQLEWNPLPTEQEAVFAKLISDTKLQHLSLRGNRIGNSLCQGLSDALKTNKTLKSIDLWSNDITDEGLAVLSSMLLDNKTLLSLSVGRNRITENGVSSLLSQIGLIKMSEQELQSYRERERLLAEVQKKPVKGKKPTMEFDIAPLEPTEELDGHMYWARNHTLLHINLSYNLITDTSNLADRILLSRSLSRVVLIGNPLTEATLTSLSLLSETHSDVAEKLILLPPARVVPTVCEESTASDVAECVSVQA
eukprot:GILK01000942.1.p1 GENE.GILK01000942.1~~GILK01000942.1.p1  ORF type:complete len:415 (+),score=77.79 GILK01000942.1:873-2117(+)